MITMQAQSQVTKFVYDENRIKISENTEKQNIRIWRNTVSDIKARNDKEFAITKTNKKAVGVCLFFTIKPYRNSSLNILFQQPGNFQKGRAKGSANSAVGHARNKLSRSHKKTGENKFFKFIFFYSFR